MRSQINVQKLFLDVPDDKARLLNFLKAKNFMSVFGSDTLVDKGKVIEENEGVTAIKNKNNKIAEQSLSVLNTATKGNEKIKEMNYKKTL